MKRALITGITGQDGAYLTKLLLRKGYHVTGVLSPDRSPIISGLEYLDVISQVSLVECDMLVQEQVSRTLRLARPDEIYHLAAQSSVARSFASPRNTMEFNTVSIVNLLEVMRLEWSDARLYHASSSEIFGRVDSLPVTAETRLHPVSPYAVSKVAAHQTVSCYRESYDLFAVSGILFNHESFLRRTHFFSKKLIQESLAIARGEQDVIHLGELNIRRDFGFAPMYVDAMYRMLQQTYPKDYLICSGESVSLRSLVEHVFGILDIPLERIVEDPALKRPNEILDIFGTNASAKDELGWSYELTAFEMMDILLRQEQDFGAANKP